MRLQYSTLSDYFGAVAASNAKFATVQGDFFPYADNDDSLWTVGPPRALSFQRVDVCGGRPRVTTRLARS